MPRENSYLVVLLLWYPPKGLFNRHQTQVKMNGRVNGFKFMNEYLLDCNNFVGLNNHAVMHNIRNRQVQLYFSVFIYCGTAQYDDVQKESASCFRCWSDNDVKYTIMGLYRIKTHNLRLFLFLFKVQNMKNMK